jgi:deoxyribose-phosphate aldolase
MPNYSYRDMAKMIDHSLLNPTMTTDAFEEGCRIALAYDVASVCIMPYYLQHCSEILRGSDVKASTTIGFPHGANTTATKLAEVLQALAEGAAELDMVVNISKVLSGDWKYIAEEIDALTYATHAGGAKLKVIFENCYLNDEQKIRLCEICTTAGVDWVKTSTGYGSGGATMDDLRLMRKHAGPNVQVKAAGGVRDFDTLLQVREIGASRCGATRTQTMLDECRKRLGMDPITVAAVHANTGY